MIAALVACLFLPPMRIRAEFIAKIAQVQNGWTPDQVQAALGPPDDIWPPDDSPERVELGDTAWCYGTNGHHTFPTLGRITFKNGQVKAIAAPQHSPNSETISEKDLREAMRFIYAHNSTESELSYTTANPLNLIQMANKLSPMGKEKIVAVLSQYSPLLTRQANDEVYWLIPILFKTDKPFAIFTDPPPGPKPYWRRDLNKNTWPTYPIIIADGIPIECGHAPGLSRDPSYPTKFIQDQGWGWTMADPLKHPPEDPFLTVQKLTKDPALVEVFHHKFDPSDYPGVDVDPSGFEDGMVLNADEQICTLTQTVFTHKLEPLDPPHYATQFEQYHQEFLKSKPHWDASQQMYVRQDGSHFDQTHQEYKQYSYSFTIPDVDIKVTLSRQSESTIIYSIATIALSPNAPGSINIQVLNQSGAPIEPGGPMDIGPPGTTAYPTRLSANPNLPPSTPIKFVITTAGKTYESPYFTL